MKNIKVQVPDKLLKPLFQSKKKHLTIAGGRAGGKSESTAQYAIITALEHEGNILCTRSVQNSISDSVYSLLARKINELGLTDFFKVTDTYIRSKVTGTRFIFRGCNALSDEKSEAGKGLDDVILCWFEEAHTAKQKDIDLIIPSIRNEKARFVWTYNSNKEPCVVSEYFARHSQAEKIYIDYKDNPFLPKQLIMEAEELKKIDPEKYAEVWEGKPMQDVDRAVIKAKWINAAIKLYPKAKKEFSDCSPAYGLDVSDGGGDENALCRRQGSLITDLISWSGGDADDTAREVIRVIEKNANLVYDRVGVGTAVKSELKRYSNINSIGHSNADKVKKKNKKWKNTDVKHREMFRNYGAQLWWEVRDRFRNTYKQLKGLELRPDDLCIYINPEIEEIEKLILQLKQIKYTPDNNGKIKIEKKEKNQKSPDKADSLHMSFRQPKVKKQVI